MTAAARRRVRERSADVEGRPEDLHGRLHGRRSWWSTIRRRTRISPRIPRRRRPAARHAAIAAADDGRCIYYSCSHEYGHLGCVLTKYDTRTGLALYRDDPIPGQRIHNLCFDKKTANLLGGTTMSADCWSCPPSSDACYFVRVDAADLAEKEQAAAPKGTKFARVVGSMGGGRWLCTCSGSFAEGGTRWFVLEAGPMIVPPLDKMRVLDKNAREIFPTPTAGVFVLWIGEGIEVRDMRTDTCLRVLCKSFKGYRVFVEADSVYLVKPKEITVLDGCLNPR